MHAAICSGVGLSTTGPRRRFRLDRRRRQRLGDQFQRIVGRLGLMPRTARRSRPHVPASTSRTTPAEASKAIFRFRFMPDGLGADEVRRGSVVTAGGTDRTSAVGTLGGAPRNDLAAVRAGMQPRLGLRRGCRRFGAIRRGVSPTANWGYTSSIGFHWSQSAWRTWQKASRRPSATNWSSLALGMGPCCFWSAVRTNHWGVLYFRRWRLPLGHIELDHDGTLGAFHPLARRRLGRLKPLRTRRTLTLDRHRAKTSVGNGDAHHQSTRAIGLRSKRTRDALVCHTISNKPFSSALIHRYH